METIGKELAKEGLEILRGTKAFVADQAPDFMRQLLAWKMAENVVVMAFCYLVLIGVAVLVYKTSEWVIRNDAEPLYLFLVLLIIPACIGSAAFLELLKLYFAPKVFLMEYFAGLLK